MKAIVKKEPKEGFELMDIKEPEINRGDDVKIKVLKSSVCGTDFHIYKWDEWAQETIKTPQINGHEVIAEIVELGDNVRGFSIGEIIVCETHLHCGTCYQCRTGNAHICINGSILGVNRDGIWCEYQVVPQNILWKIGSIDNKYAGIMEPLGNAIHTLSYSEIRGQNILVVGAGPIGLMAAYAAIISGAATVTITELNPYRIQMIKDMNVGINIINPVEDDVHERVQQITNGHGIDVALEMSGNRQGLLTACDLVIPGGDLNILSLYPAKQIELPLNELVFKNIKMQFVTGRRLFSTWNTASMWLEHKIMDPKVLDVVITHEFKMEEFDEVFKVMKDGKCGKIILDFTHLGGK